MSGKGGAYVRVSLVNCGRYWYIGYCALLYPAGEAEEGWQLRGLEGWRVKGEREGGRK